MGPTLAEQRTSGRTIRPAEAADTPAVSTLLADERTHRPHCSPETRRPPEGSQAITLVAESDGRVVGVVTGQVIVRESTLPEDTAVRLPMQSPAGVLQSLVVEAPARGHGIGSELSAAITRQLWAAGAKNVISFAWVRPDGSIPARAPLTAAGLRLATVVPDFWSAEPGGGSYECSECDGSCRCSAAIFYATRRMPDSTTPVA